MVAGEAEEPERRRGASDDDRALRRCRVEDGQGIADELAVVVCSRTDRPIGLAIAARVERDDPIVA